MVVRALVLLAAFAAGPAISWNCLFSCGRAPAADAASDHACHGATDVTALVAAPDCGTDRAHVSPFVKTTASAPEMLAGTPAMRPTHESIPAHTAPTFLPIDTGPSAIRTSIPLRI